MIDIECMCTNEVTMKPLSSRVRIVTSTEGPINMGHGASQLLKVALVCMDNMTTP